MGFKVRDAARITDGQLLMTRKTWNTNRAVVYLRAERLPEDLPLYLKKRRWETAKRVGFLPVLWGLGLQVVLSVPSFQRVPSGFRHCVASIDNQWCIVQSLFLIDEQRQRFTCTRSWGQVLTGQYQDRILEVIGRRCEMIGIGSSRA